jgi:hypothetical protein
MKTLMNLMVASAIGCLASAGPAYAAESTKEVTPQQQRMADCNKMAGEKGLKSDARKQFMSSCLSGKAEASPAAATGQQEKMKSCNAEAAKQALKGDDRKKFMSSCLSN